VRQSFVDGPAYLSMHSFQFPWVPVLQASSVNLLTVTGSKYIPDSLYEIDDENIYTAVPHVTQPLEPIKISSSHLTLILDQTATTLSSQREPHASARQSTA
jgi:hypothetical protein